MTRKLAKPFIRRGVFILRVAISLLVLLLGFGSIYTYAQSGEKVREFPGDFVAEDGCPVSVNSIRTALDLDPFGVPIDGRIYINYKNVSDKQIDAVKFRLRFVDATGTDVGTFQAADGALVAPGGDHDQKWRREPISQKVVGMKVRVLQVKCPDGSMWESSKMNDIANPQPQPQPQSESQPATGQPAQ